MKKIHLEKGKLLDAQEGFVETFNWLVDAMSNLCGDGSSIDVEWAGQSTPMVSYIGSDDDLPEVPENTNEIEPIDQLDLSGISGDVTVVGTDSSEATGTKIIFQSESDSNMTLKVSTDENGNVIVKVGAYYR